MYLLFLVLKNVHRGLCLSFRYIYGAKIRGTERFQRAIRGFYFWSILKVAWNIMTNLAPCKLTQLCWMLHVSVRLHTLLHIIACYCMLLHVVTCCWELFRKVWNWSNFWANNSQHFFCSVIAFTATSSKIVGVTRAPRWLSNLNLQSRMGCILFTMHCRPQHCWELLHPFAHHC